MYKNMASELKKNIEIMEGTFEANNLQVLNLSVRPCSEDDADCQIYVEVASIDGCNISQDINIKINLYDENGDLFLVECGYIDSDTFSGYDTLDINCYSDNSTLQNVTRGRLYVTR